MPLTMIIFLRMPEETVSDNFTSVSFDIDCGG